MKCRQCGAEIADDSVFCPECGARCDQGGQQGQPQNGAQMVFCPNCGQPVEAGTVFCPNCGQPVSSGKRGGLLDKKKLLIVGAAAGAVVILIAAVGIGKTVLGGIFSGGGDDEKIYNKEELLYIQDESLFHANLKKLKKDPIEYTDELIDTEYDPMTGMITSYATLRAVFTQDGKYCYYPERIDENYTYRLMRIRTGGKKEVEKVDSNVVAYTVLASGDVIYQKDNSSLYYWDGKDKTKVDSDVSGYRIAEDEKHIVWTCYNDGEDYDLYYQKLGKDEEKVKVESAITRLITGNDDFSKIYYEKNDNLYLVEKQEEQTKLASNVEDVLRLDPDKGTFYFTEIDEDKRMASDFVTDDIKGEDNNYRWDRLRESLKTYEIEWKKTSLYYFDGKEEQLVADQIGGTSVSFEGGIIFRQNGDGEGDLPKVRLSEISYASDVEYRIADSGDDVVYCMAIGNQVTQLDTDHLSSLRSDSDRQMVYALEGDEEDDEKTLISINAKKGGEITVVDEDVEAVEGILGDSIYYYKDIDRDHYSGELYCDGEEAVSDVAIGSVVKVPDSSMVVCIVDGDEDDKLGTLVSFKGGKSETIADDVTYYDVMGEKAIVMLSDYDFDRHTGDLLYFQGKKCETVETDVQAFFAKGNTGMCP